MLNIVWSLVRRPMSSLQIPQSDGSVILEYFALDNTRLNITTKTYVTNSEPKSVEECPTRTIHQYETVDMTQQASMLPLQPVAMYADPFRQGKHKLVLCELHRFDGTILDINTRFKCRRFMETVKQEEIWIGFEQEYMFTDCDGVPADWDMIQQNPDLYTEAELFKGKHVAVQREISDKHLEACMYAGLSMYGKTRESFPSCWEYQLAPLPMLQACDQLIVSRYILMRLVERYGLHMSFSHPECLRSTSLRLTQHLNFSTRRMREDGGIKYIYKAFERISKHDQESIMKHYNLPNSNDYKWRLNGKDSMPHYDELVIKVTCKDRTSLRIPGLVARDGKGYFEERRVSADADPYDVTRVLASAALFDIIMF